MNLGHHVDVLLRQKGIVAGGLVLAVVLAILAIYQVPSMQRRGAEVWSVNSQILVTQSGFPEGRVTLPNTGTDFSGTPPTTGGTGSSQLFADPGRLSNLAVLYSAIAVSDQVRSKLPGHVDPHQIDALALDASGNGSNYLPIIQLSTKASTSAGAERLNSETYFALKGLLATRQEENDINPTGRIKLSLLTAPSDPLLLSGPSLTPAALAFLLCMIATIAVAHVREGLTLRRTRAEAEEGFGGPFDAEPSVLRRGELASIRTGTRRTG